MWIPRRAQPAGLHSPLTALDTNHPAGDLTSVQCEGAERERESERAGDAVSNKLAIVQVELINQCREAD